MAWVDIMYDIVKKYTSQRDSSFGRNKFHIYEGIQDGRGFNKDTCDNGNNVPTPSPIS